MARPGERRQQGEPGKWARREQGGTGDKGRCVGIMWLGIWLGGEGGVGGRVAPNRQYYRFSRESVGAPNILLYAF